jgi:hypothetical protein
MNNSTKNLSPADLSRRAAACVRACEGIPTEQLEDDVIVRLVAAVVHVADDRVREVLEELSPRPPAATGARPAPGGPQESYPWGPQSSLSRERISSTPSIDIGRPTQ